MCVCVCLSGDSWSGGSECGSVCVEVSLEEEFRDVFSKQCTKLPLPRQPA